MGSNLGEARVDMITFCDGLKTVQYTVLSHEALITNCVQADEMFTSSETTERISAITTEIESAMSAVVPSDTPIVDIRHRMEYMN